MEISDDSSSIDINIDLSVRLTIQLNILHGQMNQQIDLISIV